MAVYYVDKGVGVGGAGTEGDPFDSILDAFDACFPLAGDPATRQPLAEDTTVYLTTSTNEADVIGDAATVYYTESNTLTLIQTDRTSAVWDDTKYRVVRANGEVFSTSGDGGSSASDTHRMTCLNLQIEQSSNSADDQVVIDTPGRARRGNFIFHSVIIKGSGDDTYSKRVIRLRGDDRFAAAVWFINSVVFNMGNAGGSVFFAGLTSSYCPTTTFIANSTFNCPGMLLLSRVTQPEGFDRVFIYNNIINASGYGTKRNSPSTNVITTDYNTCFFEDDDEVDGETVLWTHGANDIVNVASLPFTNAANGDFRLSSTDANVVDQGDDFSTGFETPPAKSSTAGQPSDVPGWDYDHLETNTRPQGAAWDIGAYEFIAPEVFNYPRFLMGPKA